MMQGLVGPARLPFSLRRQYQAAFSRIVFLPPSDFPDLGLRW